MLSSHGHVSGWQDTCICIWIGKSKWGLEKGNGEKGISKQLHRPENLCIFQVFSMHARFNREVAGEFLHALGTYVTLELHLKGTNFAKYTTSF